MWNNGIIHDFDFFLNQILTRGGRSNRFLHASRCGRGRLCNKLDELQLLVGKNRDFYSSFVPCFTEMWLCHVTWLQLAGFQLIRADRDTELSSKRKGGGVCFYINNGWCSDVTVIHQQCSPNLEFLIINCKFYSPMSLLHSQENLSQELPKYSF